MAAPWTGYFGRGSGGGGAGGAGYDFLFDQNAVQNPAINLYSSWPALIVAINALPKSAPPVVTIARTFTVPLGVWNMNNATLRAVNPATGQTVLTVPAGATLDNLAATEHGIAIAGLPTFDGETFTFSYVAQGEVAVLSVGLGSVIINGTLNNSALILTKGPAPGPTPSYFVLASILAQWGSVAPSTGPLVREAPGDIVIATVVQDGLGGKLADGWIVGAGPSTLIYSLAVDSIAPKTPGYLGTTLPLDFAQAVTSPLAIKGAVRSLIYTTDPIGPSDTDTFSSWPDLYAYWTLLKTPKQIVVKHASGAPCHVPAGTWNIEGMAIVTANPLGHDAQLWLDNGAVLLDLAEVGQNLAIVGNSASPSLTFSPPPNPGGVSVLKLNVGANLANTGASVMIQWDRDNAIGFLIVALLDTASIAAFGATPVIDVTPSGAFTSVVGFYSLTGGIQDGTLSGSDGPGTALFLFNDLDGQYGLNQPGWTAAAPLSSRQSFQVQQRPRVNIQTDPLASGALYSLSNGSELVRCAPTGVGAITVTLPDPRFFPDETVLVKKTTADVIDAINVSAAGGSTIDGAVAYALPPTPYSVLRFTSDGANWWVT